MKKIVALSGILVMVSLFIGCGSSDKGGSSEPVKNNNANNNGSNSESSELLGKARSVNGASTEMTFRNRAGRRAPAKMHQKLSKSSLEAGIYSCSQSGTFEVTIMDIGDTVFSHSNCIYLDEDNKSVYEDGTVKYGNSENPTEYTFLNYTYIPDFEDYPNTGEVTKKLTIAFYTKGNEEMFYIDGEMDFYDKGNIVEKLAYSNFLYKENTQTKAFYVKGGASDTFKCFAENYTYKTSEESWLLPQDTNPDYYKSGSININGMTYTYNGDMVTLSENGKTATFTQKEVLESFEETSTKTDCSNPSQLSKGFKKSILE
jgi:hypothetical protein